MARMTISIEEAQELSESNTRINLDITSGLTPEIATLLVKSKGGICLNNLTILSDEVAEILATYSGELYLGGPRLKVSNIAIKKLSSYRGPHLCISDIYEFNLDMATYLAKHEGNLTISSYKDVGFTEDALVALSEHKGDLCFWSEFELTDIAIKELLKHKGKLSLERVTNMSSSIVRKFKKHDGPVELPMKEVTTTRYVPY